MVSSRQRLPGGNKLPRCACGHGVQKSGWTVGVAIDDYMIDLHARPPMLVFGVNFPADFQHVGMDAKFGCDLVQLGICFKIISEFQPALGGFLVIGVGRNERLHARIFAKSGFFAS